MVEMFHRDALPPRHRLKPNLSETEPMLAGRRALGQGQRSRSTMVVWFLRLRLAVEVDGGWRVFCC